MQDIQKKVTSILTDKIGIPESEITPDASFVKDLGIVLDQARLARQATPLAAAAHQMFLAASGQGHGTADDSQVIRAYRTLNGTKKK